MKVLVWNNFKLLERRGGPPTYLYNLKQAVLNSNNNQVEFLDLYGSDDDLEQKTPLLKRLRKKAAQYIYHGKLNNKLRFKLFLKIFPNISPELPEIDYDAYDFIHFHSTIDFYQYRKVKAKFKGKIILTSHCPKPPYLELIEDVFKLNKDKISKKNFKILKDIDDFAIKNADYLLFPCETAIEPYINAWEGFTQLIKNKEIAYVPTGIPPAQFKIAKAEFRKEHNIPKEAIVFSYIGRHNSIKGYDLLKLAATEILKENPNVYFTIAGVENPLSGLDHPRWIEIGWTTDPHSLVNASDCFVLPNKETFFDLVLLEVLSINQKCLLSFTGGNKYFEKFNDPNIFFFKEITAKALINTINQFIEKEQFKTENTTNRIYQENFTSTHFLKDYCRVLDELLVNN